MPERHTLHGQDTLQEQDTLRGQGPPPEPPLRQKLGWFAALYAAGLVTITAVAYAIRWGMGMG